MAWQNPLSAITDVICRSPEKHFSPCRVHAQCGTFIRLMKSPSISLLFCRYTAGEIWMWLDRPLAACTIDDYLRRAQCCFWPDLHKPWLPFYSLDSVRLGPLFRACERSAGQCGTDRGFLRRTPLNRLRWLIGAIHCPSTCITRAYPGRIFYFTTTNAVFRPNVIGSDGLYMGPYISFARIFFSAMQASKYKLCSSR